MAYTFKFSVGKVKLGSDYVAPCQGITVSFDGNPAELFGGDYRYPLALELGNQSCEITVECAEFGLENFPGDAGGSAANFLTNTVIDLELEAGVNGGGLAGIIKNCKVTNCEVVSTQDDFVKTTLTLKKIQYLT